MTWDEGMREVDWGQFWFCGLFGVLFFCFLLEGLGSVLWVLKPQSVW